MIRTITIVVVAALLMLALAMPAFAARPAQDKQDCRDAERQGSTYTQPYKNYNNVYDNNGDCIQSVK
jgi:hypothetical protein